MTIKHKVQASSSEMELGSISADPGSPWVATASEEVPCFPLSHVQPKGCLGIHPGESILVFQPQARNTQPPWSLGVPPSQDAVCAFPMELEFRDCIPGLGAPWQDPKLDVEPCGLKQTRQK